MSRSLARVVRALGEAGLSVTPLEMAAETRTAAQAAAAAGCALDQIAKSIVLEGEASRGLYLFLTAGSRRIDLGRAAELAGEALGRADAETVRMQTGFAIGGVAPVGHLTPMPVFADPQLMSFAVVWAAAGTPRHVFPIAPDALLRITGARLAEFTQPGEASATP